MSNPPESQDQLLLEALFGTKFEPIFAPHVHSRSVEAAFFDGFVFWEITLTESEKYLYFRANTSELFPAFSILEVGVSYSSLRLDKLTGDIPVLIIVPRSTEEDVPPFWVTQGEKGRFSLATCLGNIRNS